MARTRERPQARPKAPKAQPRLAFKTSTLLPISGLLLLFAFIYTAIPSNLLPPWTTTAPTPANTTSPLHRGPNHITRPSARSMSYIAPTEDWNMDANHPRYRLFSALMSFHRYLSTTTDILQKKYNYQNIPTEHQELLAPVNYGDKVAMSITLGTLNAIVTSGVLEHGMAVYNISWRELEEFMELRSNAENHSRVNWALRHLVRDWSLAGVHERSVTFPAILGLEEVRGRVMVPGAGAGRLATEIAALQRVSAVVANEYSWMCLLPARWVLDRDEAGKNEIFPHIENWSNHRTSYGEGLFRGARVPDALPRAEVEWREGDFTTEFVGEEGTFDSIVTLFFIDTALNIVQYIQRLYDSLKKGGVWVNLGPVQYGTSPLLELSVEEVLMVVEKVGFKLEFIKKGQGHPDAEDSFPEIDRWKGKVKNWRAEYTSDSESLRKNVYLVQYWIARKL